MNVVETLTTKSGEQLVRVFNPHYTCVTTIFVIGLCGCQNKPSSQVLDPTQTSDRNVVEITETSSIAPTRDPIDEAIRISSDLRVTDAEKSGCASNCLRTIRGVSGTPYEKIQGIVRFDQQMKLDADHDSVAETIYVPVDGLAEGITGLLAFASQPNQTLKLFGAIAGRNLAFKLEENQIAVFEPIGQPSNGPGSVCKSAGMYEARYENKAERLIRISEKRYGLPTGRRCFPDQIYKIFSAEPNDSVIGQSNSESMYVRFSDNYKVGNPFNTWKQTNLLARISTVAAQYQNEGTDDTGDWVSYRVKANEHTPDGVVERTLLMKWRLVWTDPPGLWKIEDVEISE